MPLPLHINVYINTRSINKSITRPHPPSKPATSLLTKTRILLLLQAQFTLLLSFSCPPASEITELITSTHYILHRPSTTTTTWTSKLLTPPHISPPRASNLYLDLHLFTLSTSASFSLVDATLYHFNRRQEPPAIPFFSCKIKSCLTTRLHFHYKSITPHIHLMSLLELR